MLDTRIKPWEVAAVLAVCLLILVMTLYPFTFAAPDAYAATTGASIRPEPTPRTVAMDIVRNILLFVPFGVAFALLLRSRQWAFRRMLAFALMAGLGLSLTVEILQLYLPRRVSSVRDLLTNGIGAMIGVIVYRRWGDTVLRRLSAYYRRADSPRGLMIAAGLYLTVLILLTVLLPQGTYLHNWDAEFPLLLGNEETGDRPWHGRMYELQLANHAMTRQEVAAVFSGDDLADLLPGSLLAAYHFVDGIRAENRSAEPVLDLQWRGNPPSLDAEQGAPLSSEHWLQTSLPATSLVEKIAETSQLSLVVRFAADTLTQTGPARILSISTNPYLRNFTLGQEGSALVIRLRTRNTGENGSNPEWVIPGVLTDNEPHRVILTYRPSVLSVYVDRVESAFVFSLAPEISLFRMRPMLLFGLDEIALTPVAMWVYKVLFGLLAFVPLGLLMGRLIAQTDRLRYPRIFLLAGAVLAPPLLLESSAAVYSGLQSYRILLGVALMILSMAGSWLTLKLA
jgi:glycopeptide antibiotics resistance protein